MANTPNRYDDDEDDRPRPQRRRDEDDGDDRPSRPAGRYRRDGDEAPSRPAGKKLSILGVLSVIGGILSLIVAFIPCVGMMSIVTGVIGLVLGGIGLLVAGGSNHGKGFPIAGVIVNLLSILVAVIWLVILAGMGKSNADAIKEVESADAIKISASDLSKEYNTNVVKADATYKDKVVEVTGKVKLVSKERPGRITVEIGTVDTIDCDFGSATQSDLVGIEVGQAVTIRGKVKGIDRKSEYLVLETCKLVKGAEPATATVPTKPAPAPVVTDAAKLFKDYSSNTLKADGLYKGKYLELKLKVERVSIEDGKPTLVATARGEDEFGAFQCEFPASAKDQLAMLEAKDAVTVRGTCKHEDGQITLTNCVLVK